MRCTLRTLMIAIAVCAVTLAILRAAPITAFFVVPCVASLWDMRSGGKGLIAGSTAGAITVAVLGFFVWFAVYCGGHHAGLSIGLSRLVVIVPLCALAGGLIGLAQGIALQWLRSLPSRPSSS